MQEGSFIVSCVLNTSQRIMIVYARNDVEITRVALQTPEDGYVKLEEMATTLGIKGSISDDTERVVLWVFSALAPWLVAAFFMIGMLPVKKYGRVIGYGALAAAVLYLFLSMLPARFFPNRWSDFNFYAQIPQMIKTFADNGTMIRDRMMAWDRNCLVGMALANCIIVWRLVKTISKPRVLKGSSISIAFRRFDRRCIR